MCIRDSFHRFSRLYIHPSELSLLLRGQVPLIDPPHGLLQWDQDKDLLRLTETQGALTQKIWFNQQLQAIELQRIIKGSDQLLIKFAQYTSEPSVPKRIRVIISTSNIQTNLKISELTINPTLDIQSFTLIPPKGVPIRGLDE